MGAGDFPLYGNNLTSINVGTNGYLTSGDATFSADRNIAVLASFAIAPVIAPLYDDLVLYTGGSIRESVTNDYYTVTYDISGLSNSNNSATVWSVFQVTLFKAAVTQGGIAFQRGDIFFSYGDLNAPVDGSDFTVGVGQNSGNATGAFGTTGQFPTVANFFGSFDEANEGILFRSPSGGTTAATLTQSLRTISAAVVPEAGTAALLLPALGILGTVVTARRRK